MEIRHFSHNRHPLMLHRSSLDFPDGHCSACQEWCTSPIYRCYKCGYYLHKSCTKLPAEIEHFCHSSCSLSLHAIEADKAVNCDVCQESWRGFTYRCKGCDFKMDVRCAKLQPEIQLSIHPDHPLTLQVGDAGIDSYFTCNFCNSRSYSNRGWTFRCEHCNFKIDPDCARMLLNSKLEPIQHVSHEHWLTFDWKDPRDRKYYCAACRKVCNGATYSCKRCYFFLHKSCAEYPTTIQLSLHSDHPLTLRTGTTKVRERCNFCNLICRALTFCCDVCNLKIDFSCARMLTNFAKFDEISHFTHPHTLYLYGHKMDDDAHCYACNKHLPGKFYGCLDCSFYLHKSCGLDLIEHYSDYKHIQNAFHNHPLEFVYYNSNVSGDVWCFGCGKRCLGPTCVCFLCRFDMHEACLRLLETICQNSFHKHSLIIIQKKVKDSTSCSACGEPCFDKTFACLKCKYYFHELCLELPQEIQYLFHPCPLTLRQETTNFRCRACEKWHTQFSFHCNKCQFYVDVKCALMFKKFEGQKYILNPSHGHRLILCNTERIDHVVSCNGCKQVISGQIYVCIQHCKFYLHISCAAAPQQIKHPFHPNHTLTLCNDGKWWCTVSILKTLDERGEVKYLRHNHFSILEDENEVCCGACEKRSVGPSYKCSKCNFFIHQDCLEPAEEVQHPFRLHDPGMGVSRPTRCDACHNRCYGFSYICDDECNFLLDVHCASLKPSIKYEAHEHLLTFFKKMHDDPECEICKSCNPAGASYLRCVECDFNIHLLCVPLPHEIKHKCHVDPLYLEDCFCEDDSDSDDSDKYYCDACENTRDPRECVYRCKACANYVAEINCVIDEVLLSLGRKGGDVEFRIVNRVNRRRGVTLEYILNSSNEVEQKEFECVELAISDLIRERMSRADVMNRNDFLEDLECSDETFILFLKNFTFDDGNDKIVEFLEMSFWELESEVEEVEGYMVSQNFNPILKSLFKLYGDISSDSTLRLRTKTRFFNIFGGVVHSMCNTKLKDVNRNLLFNWWKHFKLVQHAGFNIQFAFEHLYKRTQSWIRIVREFDTDRTIHDYQMKINDQTIKSEELKVQLKEHITSKKGKSVSEKQRLIEDFELYSKMVGLGFLSKLDEFCVIESQQVSFWSS